MVVVVVEFVVSQVNDIEQKIFVSVEMFNDVSVKIFDCGQMVFIKIVECIENFGEMFDIFKECVENFDVVYVKYCKCFNDVGEVLCQEQEKIVVVFDFYWVELEIMVIMVCDGVEMFNFVMMDGFVVFCDVVEDVLSCL